MVLSIDRWFGKVAIVTGASSGIGAATAEKLVGHGLQVVGIARRKDRLEALAKKLTGKKGKFHPMTGDVTKEQDILNVFDWTRKNLGPCQILINNAGIICNSAIIGGKTEDWLQTINVNVVALCTATREALKDMMDNNLEGHIININSIAGHYILPGPNLEIYTATKHCVTSLTESMRKEMGRLQKKIKFTSISPGVVATEILARAPSDLSIDISINLQAEDIADAIEYVLSTPPRVQGMMRDR
ncbi:unnamed protein product [Acanthoscelides obtectus]|uniref:Farnesol dehydrogenase-like n=1 Tax=Acanthoscelides obtectus TaxID=200917 RepID=A0A9P0LDT5_ACAOB|nr:unnamed protein product [Acanthoscelides obtectus]CAK1674003.1 Farnesol dehydrogenase [Acanthoscelides obtectus]